MGRRSSVCRLAAQVICSLSAEGVQPISRLVRTVCAQFPLRIEVWFLRIFSVRPERPLSIHVYIDRGFRRMLRRIFTRLVCVHLATPYRADLRRGLPPRLLPRKTLLGTTCYQKLGCVPTHYQRLSSEASYSRA